MPAALYSGRQGIGSRRIAGWPQHPHQALGGSAGFRREPLGADHGVDKVTQDRLAHIDLAAEKLFHRFGQPAGGAVCHRQAE